MNTIDTITTTGRIDRLTVARVKAGRKEGKGAKYAFFARVDGKWAPLAECAKPTDVDAAEWTKLANAVADYDGVMALMVRAAECCGIILGAALIDRVLRAQESVDAADAAREVKRIAALRKRVQEGRDAARDKGGERYDRDAKRLADYDAAHDPADETGTGAEGVKRAAA